MHKGILRGPFVEASGWWVRPKRKHRKQSEFASWWGGWISLRKTNARSSWWLWVCVSLRILESIKLSARWYQSFKSIYRWSKYSSSYSTRRPVGDDDLPRKRCFAFPSNHRSALSSWDSSCSAIAVGLPPNTTVSPGRQLCCRRKPNRAQSSQRRSFRRRSALWRLSLWLARSVDRSASFRRARIGPAARRLSPGSSWIRWLPTNISSTRPLSRAIWSCSPHVALFSVKMREKN